MIEEFDNRQNKHTGANYMITAVSFAFSIYIDLLCEVFVAFITFFFILMKHGKYII